jgi:hypothetical protein
MSADLGSVAAQVAATLEGARVVSGGRDREISGLRRGRPVQVKCHHRPGTQMAGTSGWKVSTEIPAALRLQGRVRRLTRSDRRAVARGALLASTTGDAAFDERWLVEGVPRALLARLFDPTVRETLERYGQMKHLVNELYEAPLDPEVVIENGSISVAYGQAFDAPEVCGAVDLVAMLGERAAALAAEREASPPTAEQRAAEGAEIDRRAALERASSARTSTIIGVGLGVAVCAWLALQLSDCFK